MKQLCTWCDKDCKKDLVKILDLEGNLHWFHKDCITMMKEQGRNMDVKMLGKLEKNTNIINIINKREE